MDEQTESTVRRLARLAARDMLGRYDRVVRVNELKITKITEGEHRCVANITHVSDPFRIAVDVTLTTENGDVEVADVQVFGPGATIDRSPHSIDLTPEEHKRSTRKRRPKADHMLDRLEMWIPRRYQQSMIGDLREDVQKRRDNGCSEKRLIRYVRWQFACQVIARCYGILKPWVLAMIGAGGG